MNLQQIRKTLTAELKSLDVRRARVQTAIEALGRLGSTGKASVTVRRNPKFSRAARARIAAAQRARWAKFKAAKGGKPGK